MPLYIFECKNEECGNVYEELVPYDKKEKYEGIECPVCGSKDKTRHVHTVGFKFSNPIGTRRWRGHDYRFHHNLPNVIKERERAERAATQPSGLTSANPYNDIDDISNGEHFGEVK